MPFDGEPGKIGSVGTRGPDSKPKPDKEWVKAELARLEAYAAHVRSLGLCCESSEARAAELRHVLATRKAWPLSKPPWENYSQRQRGILHAQTYDAVEARHLSLRVAVGCAQLFFEADEAGKPTGPDSLEYQKLEMACAAAAETWGKPRSSRPLSKTIAIVRRKIANEELPERIVRLSNWKTRAPWLFVVKLSAGVGWDTLFKLFP